MFYDPGRLNVTCSAGDVFVTNPGGTCHSTDQDSIKLWNSAAVSAFLSGKKLNISYEIPAGSCSGNAIYSIELTN